MIVSPEVAHEYRRGGASKILRVSFPGLGLELNNGNITEESFYLRESILENDSIEFVGCVSSRMELELIGINEELKGQWMEASIHTEDTVEEPIALFHGIVDTCERKANSNKKSLTAYDQLYEKGKRDISAWYNGLTFPISLAALRNSLFSYLEIEQQEINLPNDDVLIVKRYAPTSLKAINMIKAVCQINGVFGIVNRENVFEYRILQDIFQGEDAYPPLYPPYYPGNMGGGSGQGEDTRVDLDYYRDVQYEEYTVKPVDRLTIRQSDTEEGVSYGSGQNNYIIQGNIFTLGLEENVLRQIAANIYDNVKGVEYRPFRADNNGLPYLEVGKNTARYMVKDYTASQTGRKKAKRTETGQEYIEKVFYMFTREMKGIQALQDVYDANGEEYQTEFISDLQTQIDTLKNSGQSAMRDYTYSKGEIDDMVKDWYRIVDTKPAVYEQGVIYFVRK